MFYFLDPALSVTVIDLQIRPFELMMLVKSILKAQYFEIFLMKMEPEALWCDLCEASSQDHP
jgi:hypothetical protein